MCVFSVFSALQLLLTQTKNPAADVSTEVTFKLTLERSKKIVFILLDISLLMRTAR